MKLGFVGLGDQGGPMPLRLLEAGHDVTVWARRPEVLDPYIEAGARRASDLATMAADCDWIGICVFDDGGVRQVCDAIMPHMRAGSMIVVHSTVHPDTCRTLAMDAAARGLIFVDAPVSGGKVRASDGTLTIMIGASPEAFAASEPILRAYGALIVRVGDPGAGQATKLINNTLFAAHAGLAHAALQTGDALGLDRAALVQVINASSGRAYGFEMLGAIGVGGLARVANIMEKDVGLLANSIAADAPMQPYVRLTQDFVKELEAAAE